MSWLRSTVLDRVFRCSIKRRRRAGSEAKCVVSRRVLATSPPSAEYELTELGKELVPAIEAIVAVGHKLKQIPAATARRRAASAARGGR